MTPRRHAARGHGSGERRALEDAAPLSTLNPVRRTRRARPRCCRQGRRALAAPQVVLAYQRYGAGKALAFTAQDSWLWQMHAEIPLEDMTHENLWRQLLRWLVSGVPGPVGVTVSPSAPLPARPVTVVATVSDDTYLQVNDAQVVAQVTDPAGRDARGPARVDGGQGRRVPRHVQPAREGLPRRARGGPPRGQTPGQRRRSRSRPRTWTPSTSGRRCDGRCWSGSPRRRAAASTRRRPWPACPATSATAAEAPPCRRSKPLWDMPVLFLAVVGLLSSEWAYASGGGSRESAAVVARRRAPRGPGRAPAAAEQSHLVIVVGLGGEKKYSDAFHGGGVHGRGRGEEARPDPAHIVSLGEKRARTARTSRAEGAGATWPRAPAPGDLVFVLLIGHGSSQQGESRFNLRGPGHDARPTSRRCSTPSPRSTVVFVNTASASGDFVKALAGPGPHHRDRHQERAGAQPDGVRAALRGRLRRRRRRRGQGPARVGAGGLRVRAARGAALLREGAAAAHRARGARGRPGGSARADGVPRDGRGETPAADAGDPAAGAAPGAARARSAGWTR